MRNESSAAKTARVLVVGRSPSVLVEAVRLLLAKGYRADATNQFEQVLDDYDVTELDVLVFGGMVPVETKQHLREEIAKRNGGIAFVQGFAGIPGVIAAQVEAVTHRDSSDVGHVAYVKPERAVTITLDNAEHVTVEAFWGTSFTPPEPTSTSTQVFSGEVAAGTHKIALPDQVPDVASFAVVTVGAQVRVFTIGPMPQAVMRMAPESAEDDRLPGLAAVTSHVQDG